MDSSLAEELTGRLNKLWERAGWPGYRANGQGGL